MSRPAVSKPRALVIGSQGQVARALAEVLPAHGIGCIVATRPDADLTRPDTVTAIIKAVRPDVVINPAAYTAVDRAEDEPDLAFAVNATAAGHIAAAAASIGAPITHLSTDYVFDGRQSTPYLETDSTGPVSVYGQSKLAGEHAVAAANPHHIIVRTAWVCSPFGTNFVKTMLRLATERPEVRVVADQHGAPTFAHDIAAAIARIVAQQANEPPKDAFGIFHLASQGETTWCGLARAVMDGSAQRGGPYVPVTAITTAGYPTKARRPAYSKLATGKLATVYGITLPEWERSLAPCLDRLIGPVTSTHELERRLA